MYHALLLVMEFLTLGTQPFDAVVALAPGALVVVTAAATAFLALYLVRRLAPWPTGEAAADAARAMRRRSERLPTVTYRAPDTAGKPRPRAPGPALPAAR